MPDLEHSADSDSTLNSVPASVPLHRTEQSISKTKPPVWAITDSPASIPIPTASKCSRHSRNGEVCCKELKGDDERTLIDPDVVRDAIIGLSDGLTVPFALAAGLSSLGESKLVVLGGIAELIAGAISMGIGGFLASQAERDHYRYVRKHTAARVSRSCAGEIDREVQAVLGPVGVDEKTCRAVAKCLRDAEYESEGSDHSPSRNPDIEDGEQLRWAKDVGMTSFIMKFGEQSEEVPNIRLYISAFTIGMGYLLGGIIPLIPYFFIPKAQIALIYSSIVTGMVLLVFGAVKARITGSGSYVWGAVSTLFVGGLAAAAAFGIVRALET